MEGGGQGAGTRAPFREAMEAFLGRGTRTNGDGAPYVIPCGGRSEAYRDFDRAVVDHPDDLVLFLVDAEGPLKDVDPRKHLEATDGWDCPHPTASYHLMVQVMESWLIADASALAAFVSERGGHVDAESLPDVENVEQLSKRRANQAITRAMLQFDTRYRKIDHVVALLKVVDPEVVRKRAPHCNHLFTTLGTAIARSE